MIRCEERDEGLVVLRLEHGKANALDLELAEALADRLESLRGEHGTRALVLTGTGTIFSAGVDLFRVLEEDEEYVDAFLSSLGRLLRDVALYPRPVVAALNGHAVAGGCVLACACDLRLMAAGDGTIGVPELRVGIPFPALALDLVRAAVPPVHLREIVYGGRTYGPRDALERGLIDEIVEPARLLDRALEAAAELAAIPARAFALTKRQLQKGGGPAFLAGGAAFLAGGPGDAEEIDRAVVRCWKAAESREAIRIYLERTLGRSR